LATPDLAATASTEKARMPPSEISSMPAAMTD
jgi:hypothetical protein